MDTLYYVFIGLFLLVVLFLIFLKLKTRYFGDIFILDDEDEFDISIYLYIHYSMDDIKKIKNGKYVKVKIIKKRKY